MFERDLSATVKLRKQEGTYWCGKAVGQMIRNGYPPSAGSHFYEQTYLHDVIENNESKAAVDTQHEWATDPLGLTTCLNSLNNPASVRWHQRVNANKRALLFDVLSSIDRRGFPAAMLVTGGSHWVTIVGYITDTKPVAGSAATLQYIKFYDSAGDGTCNKVTADTWRLWHTPVSYSGTWHGKFVAVVESPADTGIVNVPSVERIGPELLSWPEARDFASQSVESLGLGDEEEFGSLDLVDIDLPEPLLVRDESVEGTEEVPFYYLIPYRLRETAGEGIGGCVLVNAFTGRFEQVTVFRRPVQFLTRAAVTNLVMGTLKVAGAVLGDVDVSLVYKPSSISYSRALPLWRVTTGDSTVYVDQQGKIHRTLPQGPPGN
jgi:hypothetical protein